MDEAELHELELELADEALEDSAHTMGAIYKVVVGYLDDPRIFTVDITVRLDRAEQALSNIRDLLLDPH